MKILITGASGFVGGTVDRALRQAGHDVRRASRTPPTDPGAFERVALPRPDAPDGDFAELVDGCDHVVHCAALNNAGHGIRESDFMAANADLTRRLATAAAKVVPGRFVYLSSIRAVAGPCFDGKLDDAAEPAPACAYGRSKLAGERATEAAFSGRQGLVILRLPPVYGTGMGGNLARLLRLAETPWPLPLGAIPGCRTLVSVDSTASAVLVLIGAPHLQRTTYWVGDKHPVTVAEILTAFRDGLQRPRRLVSLPPVLFERVTALAGKPAVWTAFTATQIVDASALMQEGWIAEADTPAALRATARPVQLRSGGSSV